MNRRSFLHTAAAVAAARRALGANDRIRIGLIGTGGRCQYLGTILKGLTGTEMVTACDVYEPRRLQAAEKMGSQTTAVADYRAVLDRKDIDAVVIGSPDHWHVPMTVAAVAAGKDVYVEKPVTHQPEEADRLIQAVEKSGRVVATGTQQRSWDHYLLAKQIVESGRLGRITLVQCYWYQNALRRPRPDVALEPAKLDWENWLGSAPRRPFDAVRFRRWRFFWDYGGGILTDLMTHWIDVIQWFMDSPQPKTVQATGSLHAVPDWECPDTVNAAIVFPQGYTVVYNGTMVGSLDGGGIVFRGSEGMMKLTRDGFQVYREGQIPAEGTAMPEPSIAVKSTGDGTVTNLQNWLDCLRSRKPPNAHVRAGVEGVRTAHLANQAMRTGKTLSL